MSTPSSSKAFTLDVSTLYDHPNPAKQSELPSYLQHALAVTPPGSAVVITGQGPIWLYLSVAHTLHGIARRLVYRSPEAGEVVVFDHDSH